MFDGKISNSLICGSNNSCIHETQWLRQSSNQLPGGELYVATNVAEIDGWTMLSLCGTAPVNCEPNIIVRSTVVSAMRLIFFSSPVLLEPVAQYSIG